MAEVTAAGERSRESLLPRGVLVVAAFLGGVVVAVMALVMVAKHDPEAQPGAIVVFPLLTIMSWAGLLYLIKDKLPCSRQSRELRARPTAASVAK